MVNATFLRALMRMRLYAVIIIYITKNETDKMVESKSASRAKMRKETKRQFRRQGSLGVLPARMQHHIPIACGRYHADHVIKEPRTRQHGFSCTLAVIPAHTHASVTVRHGKAGVVEGRDTHSMLRTMPAYSTAQSSARGAATA